MSLWSEDPELLETFRAEVEERVASLSAGLLTLEEHPAQRQVIAGLFRDAHTVKGSARMLGLSGVLQVAHRCEDVLGAMRDGRMPVTRVVVDVLLAACDGVISALPDIAAPGGPDGATEARLAGLADALARLSDAPPTPEAAPTPEPAPTPEAAVAPEAAPARKTPSTRKSASTRKTSSTRRAPSARIPAAASAAAPLAVPPPAPAAEPAAAATPFAEVAPSAASEQPHRRTGESVRVASDRVYTLLDVVGEAELDARRIEAAATRLDTLGADSARWLRVVRDESPAVSRADQVQALDRLTTTGAELARAAREVRELVDGAHRRLGQVRDTAMGLAMVPVRRVVAGLPRIVRDVAAATGKDVRLLVEGEDVELDKQVLDGVSDALKHLVVNAVDHGCEAPAARIAAGKPEEATVVVSARAAGGTVTIEVADDGAGIDVVAVRATAVERGLLPPDHVPDEDDVLDLLFVPAFSTTATVTEHSGRGVGLDVVRDAVESLGGSVEVTSRPGVGTRFTLVLPVTLGVLHCLLARVGDERYAIPVGGVVEAISLRDADIHNVADAPVVVRHGRSIPILDLGVAVGLPVARGRAAAVVVRQGDRRIAWAVDRFDGEREIVVKDMGPFLGRLPLVAGATIDGDGRVLCLLDLRELAADAGGSTSSTRAIAPVTVAPGRPHVLVVEDSVGVRELERAVLERAGYDVSVAVDGSEGASWLSGEPLDLVLTDVEMPGMDGFALTRAVRAAPGWEHVPVIVVTSRGSEEDRRAGLDAGASAYLLKSEFDQEVLVETVRRLVGR